MILRRICLAVPALIWLLQLPISPASAVSMIPIDLADCQYIMPLRDVKAGMKGYGKTVFRGTKPETFNVQAFGVLRNVIGAIGGRGNVIYEVMNEPMACFPNSVAFHKWVADRLVHGTRQ